MCTQIILLWKVFFTWRSVSRYQAVSLLSAFTMPAHNSTPLFSPILFHLGRAPGLTRRPALDIWANSVARYCLTLLDPAFSWMKNYSDLFYHEVIFLQDN